MSADSTIAVIIPALDEEGNIGDLVSDVLAAVSLHPDVTLSSVIVVDNGSTDRTADVARDAGASVVSEPVRGYGRACLSGTMAADADILVFMDGDRSEVPTEIGRVLDPVLSGEADLVVGSRVRGHAEAGALTVPQRWGNRVAGWLIFALYRVRVTDPGPFRAIRRSDLLALGMREMTYGWPTEMITRTARAGLRFREVPVSCRRRRAGESKVSGNLRASLHTGWRMGSVIFGVWRSPGIAKGDQR